ncbi:MAG: hypothetical protein H6R46_669, partial [Proteobacteria bacterium]|nr:hypothetical protein [Pseudomonadota bacterium]
RTLFTSVAGGLYDTIKPAEKMIAKLEYGEGENQGVYMRFGWGF